MKENFLVWLRLNWELNSTVNTGLFNSQAKRVLRARHMISACSVTISVPAQPQDH